MRVRVRFTKTGNMKYIGHLDVMRYFQKVLRRADVDVSFSGGFSPHMIMSFAAPLGVGTTSSGEYFDLDLQSAPSGTELMDRMNAQMHEGMSVVSIRKIGKDKHSKGMTLVAAADYTVSLNLSEASEDVLQACLQSAKAAGLTSAEQLPKKVQEFLAQEEVNVWRKTKRSEGEVNIRPWIYSFNCSLNDSVGADSTGEDFVGKIADTSPETIQIMESADGNSIIPALPIFHMCVSQGSVSNLKPDLVVKAFADFAGWQIPEGTLRIHRDDIYANVGSEAERKLVSLGSLGEEL